MANPIVQRKTDDGEVRSKLELSNLEPGEEFPLKLKRVSHPYEGKWGPYIFAQVETQDGEEHTVIVSGSTKAPGFLDEEEKTEFDEACKEEFGEYPERETPGKSLADLFYEAPTDSGKTSLVRHTGETDDGREFSLYYFGIPEKRESAQTGIKWRD